MKRLIFIIILTTSCVKHDVSKLNTNENIDFNKEYILEKKTGSAIVFPSNFCFPHAVLPVTKGDRHVVITWIH